MFWGLVWTIVFVLQERLYNVKYSWILVVCASGKIVLCEVYLDNICLCCRESWMFFCGFCWTIVVCAACRGGCAGVILIL